MTSNGIKNRKVEEKQKSMRQEATKFEKFKRRKSREAEEGEDKFSMKITVKVREIERETKHLPVFTTVSFQVTFSFLICASLPHIYSNNISNNDDYFCTLYRSIIISMYSILLSGVRNGSSAFRLG